MGGERHEGAMGDLLGPFCAETACLPMSLLVSSGFFGFPPQCKDMLISLCEDSKLPVVENACLSIGVSPVIDWISWHR